MSTSDAFQHELRQARERSRGNILRATVSFACENTKCAVDVVRIGIVEEFGSTLPFQWPVMCGRCRQPFERYIGLSIER